MIKVSAEECADLEGILNHYVLLDISVNMYGLEEYENVLGFKVLTVLGTGIKKNRKDFSKYKPFGISNNPIIITLDFIRKLRKIQKVTNEQHQWLSIDRYRKDAYLRNDISNERVDNCRTINQYLKKVILMGMDDFLDGGKENKLWME